MTHVTAGNLADVATRVMKGETQVVSQDPGEGTLYRLHLNQDVFAKPIPSLGGGAPRQTLVMRRLDGTEIPGSFGTTSPVRQQDVYGAADLALKLGATIDLGWETHEHPLYGPDMPTNSDRIWTWEKHADAFRSAYKTAWEGRNWQAAAEAARIFQSNFPDWMGTSQTDLKDSVRTIARNIRAEPHPPRWHMRSRYRHGGKKTGIQGHFAAERALLSHLANIAGLPGYDDSDDRTVIPVVLRWKGTVRCVLRSEFISVRARHLHPVKSDGTAMPRANPFDRSEIEAIKPARRTAKG